MRIIFVPQFPSGMRYQEWWFWKLPIEFKERGFDVEIIGETAIEEILYRRSSLEMFSPINQAIELEAAQIKEYMRLELRDDDILFWSDISFPGIFGHVLFHKRPKKMFAFCHATALNNLDYYRKVRPEKFPIEASICKLFNKIFVGSKYHQEKLKGRIDNTMVTYLPFPPFTNLIPEGVPKTIDIMSASRPTTQKVDEKIEDVVEKSFGKIERPISHSWEEYFRNLSTSRILLITSLEETFGYQVVDAVLNNCIPLARTSFSYPELIPKDYLYTTVDELCHKIDYILNANVDWVPKVQAPKLLCEEQMLKFYDVICEEMKK